MRRPFFKKSAYIDRLDVYSVIYKDFFFQILVASFLTLYLQLHEVYGLYLKKVSEQEKSGKFRAVERNDVSQRAGKIHCVPHIMNRGHHFGQTMLRQRMRSLGGLVQGFMKLNLSKFTKKHQCTEVSFASFLYG